MSSKKEREMVKALDEMALWDSLKPAIQAILRHGTGSASHLLKKSESLAAVTLLTSLASKRDDIRLKASIELLNRSLGKPVERRIDVYADIGALNESELDTQIKTLMKQVGETGAMDAVMAQVPKIARSRYRGQRKRKAAEAEMVFDEEGEVDASGSAEVKAGGEGSGGEGGVSEVIEAEVTSSSGE